NGKPVTCNECEGMLRGGFCFPCNLREENSLICDQNVDSFNDNSFNNSNYLPQPKYENYLCNLCGNNSHDGYDCQQQFRFVYEQEPSYNRNYNDNYYPYDSPSFPCCNNCGGSHETFQCQPMDQNINFSGSDQIRTPQYPNVHPLSQEKSEEVSQAEGELMKSIETFLEKFICIPFEEKPQILFQAWEFFFAIQYSKPKDPNELFQKLLGYLKELAEYDNSPSRDHPIFLNDDEDHSDQNKESPENSSKEIATLNSNEEKEEPPQDSDIHQLIEECSTEVSEEQKQSMEDTMLQLVKIYSQRLDKKEQEVKNVMEQPVEHGNRSIESMQNFRVIRKSSTFLKDTSQISSVHAIAPILSTEEPEHSLSMGYEHLSITPETESDEVTYFHNFFKSSFNDNDDLDSSDEESLPDEDVPTEELKNYSNPLFDNDGVNSDRLDPHCFNVEYDFVESLLNRDTFIDSSSKIDFSGKLAHVNPEIKESDFDFEEEIRLIENLLYDNSSPRPSKELNAKIADTIIESLPLLPIPVEDSDSQREEIDIVIETDDVLPPSVENDDDSEEDIHFLEELLSDNSIPLTEDEASDSDHQDDPSVPLPPPKPPDDEFDFEPNAEKEIPVVMNDKVEFDVSNDENDDYSYFIFVMFAKVFSFLLSAESEDTIFDPGISG
nr:hypothetical protein [Tanacetum cinerariifolium]